MTLDSLTTTPVITIGLLLLGFLLGAVIVALASQSRARRTAEAHKEQLRLLRDENAKHASDMTVATEAARVAQSSAEAQVQDLEQRNQELAQRTQQMESDYNLLNAQFVEEQELAGGMEDRLNAAEARLLTAEAELERNLADLQQWSAAYGQLKNAHNRLSTEHQEAQERHARLEADLATRREELEALNVRLDALQNALESAQAAKSDALAPESAELQASATAIAQAKAEVQALLRQREAEIADVRSQLAATRYSINVLTSSGAELADMLARAQAGEEEPAPFAALDSLPVQHSSARSPEVTAEDLTDLQGMIADWFEEVRASLPYSSALLLQFAGMTNSERFGEEQLTIEGIVDLVASEDVLADSGDADDAHAAHAPARFDQVVPVTRMLPPALMLAAIKAATTTAIDRTVNRQYELANELAHTRAELDQLGVRIHAWRAMLTTTLADDPTIAGKLSNEEFASNSDLLAASATLALTAYQKKSETLQRVLTQQASQPTATDGEPSPTFGSEEPAAINLRTWLRRLRRTLQTATDA